MFNDVSGLKQGDSVRAGGLRVGTVDDVSMRPDHTVLVAFDADRVVPMSTGTKLAVRYLNLVGDRFLELIDGPGSTRFLPAGSQIPADRTDSGARSRPAARRPETGHPGTESARRQRLVGGAAAGVPGPGRHAGFAAVARLSFTNGLADNDQVIEQLIDNLNKVVGTLADNGAQFSATIDRLNASSPNCPPTVIRSATPSTRWTTARRRSPICSARRARRWQAPSTN